MDIDSLKSTAKKIRTDIVTSLAKAGSGHLGGSLGMVDVFTVLYFHAMQHRPEEPGWEDRDRLVLSIGHIAPVLYATLAHAGYFPIDELSTLRKLGSRLQGHPGREHGLPGLELSAGSLGQGLSVATGMALAGKMDKKDWKVFCINGDGELQEGSIWEAAMSAAHHELDNLISIIDRNGFQIDGKTEDVMGLEPLIDKWRSFGWHAISCDGHNMEDLAFAIEEARYIEGKPTVILATTKMGKGVASIEDDHRWHGKAPTPGEGIKFIEEIEKYYQE